MKIIIFHNTPENIDIFTTLDVIYLVFTVNLVLVRTAKNN